MGSEMCIRDRGLLFARSGGRVLSRLGRIMIACGLCSTVFGFLYGEFFLMETEELFHFHPLFISPIHDVMALIKVALIFGIVHITIGLTLGMINAVSRGEMLEAVFGDKGVMGLVFYLGGVALVLASNLDINKFLEHPLLCGVVLTALLLIFLRPTIEAIHRREGSVVEAFFMGFGTLLETFLGFLCNTISYARLAAFALSHAALGLACAMLAEMAASPGIGAIVYVFMNLLVILLEGLSVSIQALRLTFYEFATKVYIGGEVKAYRPLTLPKVNIIK